MFCPNCGRPLMPSQYSNPQNRQLNGSINTNWIIVFVIIAIVIGTSLHYYNKSNIRSKTRTFNLFPERNTTYSIQSIKDTDEMRDVIDNTIWTSTKKGQWLWCKLEFKGDKVKMYRAFPSDGHWTYEEEFPYTLEEGRFFDDGRKFIAAVFKSKDIDIPIKFTITSGHLYMLGFDIADFILGDYEWD